MPVFEQAASASFVGVTAEGGCDPAYPRLLHAAPASDLDCKDVAPHKNFTVLAPDPHHFDNDHDGRGREG